MENQPNQQPPNSEVTYIKSFFSDVVNQCGISELAGNLSLMHHLETYYNIFKDSLAMDAGSKIVVERQRMLCLEYFQLFMSLLHELRIFLLARMQEDDPKQEEISYMFRRISNELGTVAYHIQKDWNDESIWDSLESDVSSFREKLIQFHFLIADYFKQQEQQPEPSAQPQSTGIPMPASYFEDDEEEEEDPVQQLDKEEIRQCMERSKIKWGYEQLYLFCIGAANTAIFVGYMTFIVRLWCAILVRDGSYALDEKFVGYITALIGLQFIINIRTIYNHLRRLANG